MFDLRSNEHCLSSSKKFLKTTYNPPPLFQDNHHISAIEVL